MDMSAPSGVSRRSLAIVPRFSQSASKASATLAQAGLSFNSVRIVVVRPSTPPDTLKDTTIVFSPTSPEVTLELSIAAAPTENLVAGIQFKQDAQVMFSGSANVKAVAPASAATATPVVVDVTYTGPGSTVDAVVISPGSGLYSATTSTQFTAKGFASNIEMPGTPIFWSVSDPAKATISATGLLTPTGVRGSVNVTATAANGKSSTIAVDLAPTASGIRIIQGAGQRVPAGSTLPVTAVVELYSADGLPAAGTGQTVTFSASSGAQITPATATIDANGRAQATMKVGTSAGTTYIFTATVGTMSVAWGETAAPGVPTHFVPSGATTLTLTAGVTPNPIPTLRIADASENSVSGVILKVTIQENGVNVVSPFQVPADSVGLLEVYKVAPTKSGNYTVLVETADPSLNVPSITYNVTINPGAAAKLAFTQQPPGSVVSGQTVTIKVTVQDQFGNTVTSPAPSNINLSMDAATGAGVTINGAGSVAPVSGVATFSVSFSSSARSGVKIQAVGANLPSVLSTAFNITP